MAVAWQKNWGGIRESVTKAWGVIGPNLTNIASGIRIMAGAGKDLLTGKISFDTFLAQFGVAKTSIANSIGPILAVLGEAAGAIAAKLGEWARAFVDWIGPKIPDILAGLAGLIGSILGWIGEQTIKIAPAVLNWLAGFIEGLTQIVAGMGPAADGLGPNMVTTASRLFRGFIDWIGLELWPAVRPGLERLGAAIAEFLPTLATTIITGLVSALQALGGAIASALQSAINAAFANIHLPSINLGPISIGSGGGAAGGGESGAGAQTELGYYGLQAGGIVTRPTLAMVGEAGPEAILPLRGRGGMTRNATIVVQSVLPPNEFQLLQLARMLKPALEAA